MSLNKKILKILEDNPKCPYNCYAVYYQIFGGKLPRDKQKVAMVRTELKRLSDRGLVRKQTRGFYQAKPSSKIIRLLENPETRLHGIKLEFFLKNNNIFGIDGITSQNNINGFLVTNHFEETTNNRFTRSVWWENREIVVTFHQKGLVEVFISSSKNPLSYPDMVRCYEFLKGFFEPVFVLHGSLVFVRQVGLCRDFQELRLEGLSSVSLHKFMNDFARAYQKDGVVRFEHHLTLDLSLSDAFEALKSITCVPSPVSVVRVNGDEFKDVV
jgi:hypothetical protein